MGLQGQLSDVSSESIPILLVATIANCVAYVRCLLFAILHTLGFFPRFEEELSLLDLDAAAAGSGLAGLIVLSEQLNLNRHFSYIFGGGDADGGSDSECVVCLNRLNVGDRVRKLACSHVFHKDCLDGWLDHFNFNCPLCRSSIVSDERITITRRRVARDIFAWFRLR